MYCCGKSNHAPDSSWKLRKGIQNKELKQREYYRRMKLKRAYRQPAESNRSVIFFRYGLFQRDFLLHNITPTNELFYKNLILRYLKPRRVLKTSHFFPGSIVFNAIAIRRKPIADGSVSHLNMSNTGTRRKHQDGSVVMYRMNLSKLLPELPVFPIRTLNVTVHRAYRSNVSRRSQYHRRSRIFRRVQRRHFPTERNDEPAIHLADIH